MEINVFMEIIELYTSRMRIALSLQLLLSSLTNKKKIECFLNIGEILQN